MYFLGYVVAYLLVSWSAILVFPAAIVLALLMRSLVPRQIAARIVLPISKFLLEAIGAVVAIWLATILMDKMDTKPVLLMFLIPSVAAYWNSKKRLDMAKLGATAVHGGMILAGEEDHYDHLADVRAKRAELWGVMIGLATGMLVFPTGTSFV